MKSNWLVVKQYPHLDLPVEDNYGKLSLINYISCKDNIAKHSFLPLIRRDIISYPFKKNEDAKRKRTKKVRPITYASHIDSAIFSYYGLHLSEKYERLVFEYDLNDVACAYRSIKCKSRNGNKCNIDIAKEVFDFIHDKVENGENVAVISFDIKGFYDHLDHKILKRAWMNVMQEKSMPDDEYNVFKNITKYSYVKEDKVFDLFKDRIICKRSKSYKGEKYVKRKVKHINYLRDKEAIAFCEKKDIEEIRKEKLICRRAKKDNYGIPQGLTISSVLANIYMLNFDHDIYDSIKKSGGLYRRYSDDIIIVCPINEGVKWKLKIIDKIKEYNLDIELRKTNLYNFRKTYGEIICLHEILGSNKKLEYLGFSYDGQKILIKDSGVGKYYNKMHINLRRAEWMASHVNNEYLGKVFENKLIKKFSYAGAHPHAKNKKNKTDNPEKSQNKRDKHRKCYGNYLTYMRKSSMIMNEPLIKHQLKRNIQILKISLKKVKLIVNRNVEHRLKK